MEASALRIFFSFTAILIVFCSLPTPAFGQTDFEARLVKASEAGGGKKVFYRGKKYVLASEVLFSASAVSWVRIFTTGDSMAIRLTLSRGTGKRLEALRKAKPASTIACLLGGRMLAPPVPLTSARQVELHGSFSRRGARSIAARLVPVFSGTLQGTLVHNTQGGVFIGHLNEQPPNWYDHTAFYLSEELEETLDPLTTLNAPGDFPYIKFSPSSFLKSENPGIFIFRAKIYAVPDRLAGTEDLATDIRYRVEDFKFVEAISKSRSWITKYAEVESQVAGMEEILQSPPAQGRKDEIVRAVARISTSINGLANAPPASTHLRDLKKLAPTFSYNPKNDWFDGRDIAVRVWQFLETVGLASSVGFEFRLPSIDYTSVFLRAASRNAFLKEIDNTVESALSDNGRVELIPTDGGQTGTVTVGKIRTEWTSEDFLSRQQRQSAVRLGLGQQELAKNAKENPSTVQQLEAIGLSVRGLTRQERARHLLMQGVVITKVEEGGLADSSGLGPGDIICRVEAEQTGKGGEATRDATESPGNEFHFGNILLKKLRLQLTRATLLIVRSGKTVTIPMALPKPKGWPIDRTKKSIVITVTSDKKNYQVGEPIVFTIRFFNKENKEFVLPSALCSRAFRMKFVRRTTVDDSLSILVGENDFKIPGGRLEKFKYVCFGNVVPGPVRVIAFIPLAVFYNEDELETDSVSSRAIPISINRQPWVRGKSDWRILKYATLAQALTHPDPDVIAAAERKLRTYGKEAEPALKKLLREPKLKINVQKALKLIR